MVFYEGVMFPDWKHNALIGGLTSKELVRLVLDGTRVIEEDRLPLPERIRDVQTGPDGSIYLLSDQDDGKLWRISAIGKSPD
jgi:glucose/arabinose dehydrogenase